MKGAEEQDTLVYHLTELRTRLMYSLLIVAGGFAFSWIFSEVLFDIIRAPISPFLKSQNGGLIYTGVMDKFMAHMKVSILGGIILTCPLWLYHLWMFVAPGLYAKEKKYGLAFIFSGSFLFLTGVAFVYYLIFPLAFSFLMAFGGETDQAMITIGDYLSFFMTTTIVFGLTFELPLILTILGIAGIIDKEFLVSKRRYAIVLLAALSAIVTPPDVMSMIIMMIPLTLLYEASIFLVGIFGQKPSN
jgi:sec-independent protein translocase protein TatC